MSTITLTQNQIYTKNETSKYWRNIECGPQTVELKTWSNNEPLFYLDGKIMDSHDEKEIGRTFKVCVQTYYQFIGPKVESGIYIINN